MAGSACNSGGPGADCSCGGSCGCGGTCGGAAGTRRTTASNIPQRASSKCGAGGSSPVTRTHGTRGRTERPPAKIVRLFPDPIGALRPGGAPQGVLSLGLPGVGAVQSDASQSLLAAMQAARSSASADSRDLPAGKPAGRQRVIRDLAARLTPRRELPKKNRAETLKRAANGGSQITAAMCADRAGSVLLRHTPLAIGALDSTLFYTYGDASVRLPTSWVNAKLAELFSPDFEPFLAAAWLMGNMYYRGGSYVGRWEAWESHIGCYDLPDTGNDFFFWRTGRGAPWMLFAHALTLVGSYSDEIVDLSSGTPNGEGFGNFVRNSLLGYLPTHSTLHDKAPNRTVGTVWHFRTNDSRFLGLQADGVECGTGFGYADPELGLVASCGEPYDSWQTARLDNNTYGRFLYVNASSLTCGANAYTVSNSDNVFDHITFHPGDLWTDGKIFDELICVAWLADEYGREFGGSAAPELWDQADLLVRMALRKALSWGRLFIHEMGHAYDASGHCEKGCFMEVCAQRWACAVRADLGLGASQWYLIDGYDASENPICDSVGVDPSLACLSGGESDRGGPGMMCKIAQVGQPGSSFEFCASVCASPDLSYSWIPPGDGGAIERSPIPREVDCDSIQIISHPEASAFSEVCLRDSATGTVTSHGPESA